MMSTYIHYSTGFVSDNVQTLLDTMTEISNILYSRPEKCCQKSILRLHNQTFLHDIACEEVIGRPQVLSEKNFFCDTFILWLYMLPSNTVLSVLGQQTQSSKNVTSMPFQVSLQQHQAEDQVKS